MISNKFNIGDRVRYIGNIDRAKDRIGTVKTIHKSWKATATWSGFSYGVIWDHTGNNDGLQPRETSLELINVDVGDTDDDI